MRTAAVSDGIAPLYGLVLAGGASRRMGKDKALLNYHGEPQLIHAYRLLENLCERVFASVRSDQRQESVRSSLPLIVDSVEGLGPAGGILSAQSAYPDVAWLVIACDMPGLDPKLLEYLISKRRSDKEATAFRNVDGDFPEPLCTIWEPRSRARLQQCIENGDRSLRRVLAVADIELLIPPDPGVLSNINR